MPLPLARFDMIWIKVTFFKMSKPYLSWRRCIAVGRTQYYLHSQVIDTRSCFSATMV